MCSMSMTALPCATSFFYSPPPRPVSMCAGYTGTGRERERERERESVEREREGEKVARARAREARKRERERERCYVVHGVTRTRYHGYVLVCAGA